jgi:hypothetical protein
MQLTPNNIKYNMQGILRAKNIESLEEQR